MIIGKNEIARRYANAAFSEAVSKDIYKIFSSELKNLEFFFNDEINIYRFLIAPTKNNKLKIDIIKKLELNLFTENFLLFLLKENRFSIIQMIIENLKIIELEKNNKIEVELISCFPLDQKQIDYICDLLKNYYNCEITILSKIDHDILGGIIIKIKGKIIDASLATKLKSLNNSLNFKDLIL